jgi:hypothetical protein
MKAAIFSFIPATESSMVASTKVARFIRDELEIPLIWNEEIAEHRDLDALLIVNGAYAFCKHLEALSHAIVGAKRIIWIQQDYSIVPPINDGMATSPFRKAFVERRAAGKPHLTFWTTCEKESKINSLSHYINWNCLSMEKRINRSQKNDQLVYYGSFRAGRVKYFDRFFKEPACTIMISCPNSKFAKTYISSRIKHCGPPEDLIDWLSHYGMGLYLEDRKSHSEFHSPPNRFYEMLSAGLPMVFQEEAGFTLRKAGYKELERYTVRTPLSIARKLELRELIGKEQREMWYDKAMEERLNLSVSLKLAWKTLNHAV